MRFSVAINASTRFTKTGFSSVRSTSLLFSLAKRSGRVSEAITEQCVWVWRMANRDLRSQPDDLEKVWQRIRSNGSTKHFYIRGRAS